MMSENPQDDARGTGRTPRADDATREPAPAEPQDTQVLEPGAGETQQLPPGAGETQVLEPGAGDTQRIPAGDTRLLPADAPAPVAAPEEDDEPEAQRSDVPLAVFDEPGPLPPRPGTDVPPAGAHPAHPADGYAAGGYAAPSGYGTAPASGRPAYGGGPAAGRPYPQPAPQPWAGGEPLPEPLVSTTPRTGTIVWGLVVLAVGLAVLAVTAGARFDVGLGLIWLLGGAGLVLVVASVVGSVRRRGRADTV
jgi:hypothetical protein